MRRLAILFALFILAIPPASAVELEPGDNLVGFCATALTSHRGELEEARAGERKVAALLSSHDVGYLLRDHIPLEGLANFYNDLPKPDALAATLTRFNQCKDSPPKRIPLADLQALIVENERFSAYALHWSTDLPLALEKGIATAKRRHPGKLRSSESPAAVAKAFAEHATSDSQAQKRSTPQPSF